MALLGQMRRFAKKNLNGCLGLAVVLIGLYVLKTYYPNLMEGMHGGQAGAATTLKYFYMDGCGYCEKFDPIWESWTPPAGIIKLKKESKDMSTAEKELGVTGFPAIILVDNEDHEVATFNGDRQQPEKLTDFVNNNTEII